MQVTPQTLQQIALLSRLEFDEKDEAKMMQDLNQILEWMEVLNEINTSEVEPLIHLSEEINVMREDKAKNTLTLEEALKNAPQKDENYFRVPKILDI